MTDLIALLHEVKMLIIFGAIFFIAVAYGELKRRKT